MHRYLGYTEVHWKLLLTAQAGAPNASFSGGCHCHVKVQNAGVQPAWVEHSAATLLLPGFCWRGQGRGLRTRSLTCLIPVLKGLWIQGCCLCKRWRGHCAWPFVWGKPPRTPVPPPCRGARLCQEDPGPLCGIACAWGPTQLILLLLPQTPCEWDRDAHWAWERAPIPHHLSALLLLAKGCTAGDRQMDRHQGVTETCNMALP